MPKTNAAADAPSPVLYSGESWFTTRAAIAALHQELDRLEAVADFAPTETRVALLSRLQHVAAIVAKARQLAEDAATGQAAVARSAGLNAASQAMTSLLGDVAVCASFEATEPVDQARDRLDNVWILASRIRNTLVDLDEGARD